MLGVKVNTTIQALRRFSVLGLLRRRAERRAVADLVERLEIRTPSLEQPVEFLSGGNQQKVSVSRSFLKEPSVILAYEPTQGVDVGSRFDIYKALRTRTDAGTALLVKSSDPLELAGLCDRVLVMSRGQIIEEIPGDELDELRIVEAVVRGPGLSRAGRSPLGVAMPKAPTPDGGRERRGRRRATRRPEGPPRRPRQEQVAEDRPVPPVDAGGAADPADRRAPRVHDRRGSPGFINAYNIEQILILALPLIVAAMAQTHALLVGYLDLSVGGMIGLGVVIASFLISAEASVGQILLGSAVVLLCGVALGLVNAGLIRGLKIPSIIATLATLSILDGISLTMRPTAQGMISPDLVSVLTTTIGPIPVAFIVDRRGRGPAGPVAPRLRIGARSAGGRVRRAVGEARRGRHQLGPGASPGPFGAARGRGLVLRDGAIPDRERDDRLDVRAEQHHRGGPRRRVLAGGRATFLGATVAAVLLALILTVLPYLGMSPTTVR